MTHPNPVGPAHDVEVGPEQFGPTTHGGGTASAEPGGFDEFDHAPTAPAQDAVADVGDDELNTEAVNDEASFRGLDTHPDTLLAAERLFDLQRLHAEYVNYKRRVDRDRDVARDLGISQVLEAMLPVLDDIHLAREHGDLEGGPLSAIAEKVEHTLAKFGVERFGRVGDEFDPTVHEALMHVEAELPPEATTTTVVHVLQPGYRAGDRLVRPARVSVADPQ
ncbi:MAG TPA: nucleotide exchange factor GrpE [Candidatus Lustribacter sp.]|nr:nucleotide exchange factor GrpE [Candidatus Lustribacter sp.]